MKKSSRLMVIAAFIAAVFTATPAMSDNIVDIDIVAAGTTTPVTELLAGADYEFRIWIENDVTVGEFEFPLMFWTDDGADWEWRDVGGFGSPGCITVVPESRYGQTDYYVYTDQVYDGIPPDSMKIYGLTDYYPLLPGPLEHMLSIHFTPTDVGTICMDSTYYGLWWLGGPGNNPIPGWPHGGRCWEVVDDINVCGDANNDDVINILDVTHLINYLYMDGPAPNCAGGTADPAPAIKE